MYKPNGWQAVYTGNLDYALKALSPSQAKVLNYIMQNVRKYTQKIAHRNGRVITADNLAVNLEIAHRSAQTALNVLQEKGIIKYSEKHKAYLFNPYILFKGRYTNKEVMELFANTEFAARKDIK